MFYKPTFPGGASVIPNSRGSEPTDRDSSCNVQSKGRFLPLSPRTFI